MLLHWLWMATFSLQAGLGHPCKSASMHWWFPAASQIGDWGRQGVWEQRQVAKMMAQVADCMPPAFIISTGDNFYSREWSAAHVLLCCRVHDLQLAAMLMHPGHESAPGSRQGSCLCCIDGLSL